MPISQKATGAWVENVAATPAVTLVGSPAAGDRYYIWAVWKDFSITASIAGFTEVTEYTDGSVTSATDVGSMKVGCWYRDWQSGDTNPTLTFSTATNLLSQIVCQLWQKSARETWNTPTFQTAPWPVTAATQTIAATSAAITVDTFAVVMCCIGIRDDSATFTRATTAIDRASGGTPTWTGNYVESPATHVSSITGNDMSADLGHRFVTAGAAAVVLNASATISAVETGAMLWVMQSVSYPPIGLFGDTFDAGYTNGVIWNNSASNDPAQVTAFGGGIKVAHPATAVYNRLDSVLYYDFTSGTVLVRVSDYGNLALTSHEVVFEIGIDFSNRIQILTSGTVIKMQKQVAGTFTQIGSNVTINTTTHRWLRFRESGGTIFGDTSPDPGSGWTNRWSGPSPFPVTSFRMGMVCGAWQAEASGSQAVFDSLNYIAEPLTTELTTVAIRRASFY